VNKNTTIDEGTMLVLTLLKGQYSLVSD